MEINKEAVNTLIRAKKLRPSDIAIKIKMHPKALGLVLRTGRASMETIRKIADVLNVSIDQIMEPPSDYQEAVNTAVSLVKEEQYPYVVKFVEEVRKIIVAELQPVIKGVTESVQDSMRVASGAMEAMRKAQEALEKRGEAPKRSASHPKRKKRAG